MEVIPKYLYKYREYSLRDEEFVERILLEDEFYCAHPFSFNDPFDCNVPLKLSDQDDYHIRSALWALLYGEVKPYLIKQNFKIYLHNHVVARLSAQSSFEHFEQRCKGLCPKIKESHVRWRINSILDKRFDHAEVKKFAEELSKKGIYATRLGLFVRGVLSLSEDPENLLMWSHYADNHRGIVIKIDTTCLPKHIYEGIFPVKYRKKFPKLIFSEGTQKKEYKNPGDQYALRGYLYKHTDWRYEKEWRYIGEKVGPIVFKHSICGVIFGCKMPHESKDRILDTIRLRYNLDDMPLIYQANKNDTEFKLDIEHVI